jgi:hypothetical protein
MLWVAPGALADLLRHITAMLAADADAIALAVAYYPFRLCMHRRARASGVHGGMMERADGNADQCPPPRPSPHPLSRHASSPGLTRFDSDPVRAGAFHRARGAVGGGASRW